MGFEFRRAVREGVPLLIGIAGGTGSGKTWSAMELARGLAGEKPFAVIDTENGRAKHYADAFTFDTVELHAPFRPERYADAIAAADAAGYPVIVVDSMSHEWDGDGGCLDWQEEEFQRLGSRESVKMLSWQAPKKAHRKMVTRLLQVNAHVVVCFRAADRVEMVKDSSGRTVVRPKQTLTGLDGWVPISDPRLPYELTLSLLLTADAPGMPKPIKLQRQHLPMVPLDRPLSSQTGAELAAWAAGASVKREAPPAATTAPTTASEPTGDAPSASKVESVTTAQARKLNVQVGQLRDAGKLQTRDLYRAIARGRGVEPGDLVQSIQGARDEAGDLHWGPLRETMTKQEAGGMIERLSRLEGGEQEEAA